MCGGFGGFVISTITLRSLFQEHVQVHAWWHETVHEPLPEAGGGLPDMTDRGKAVAKIPSAVACGTLLCLDSRSDGRELSHDEHVVRKVRRARHQNKE